MVVNFSEAPWRRNMKAKLGKDVVRPVHLLFGAGRSADREALLKALLGLLGSERAGSAESLPRSIAARF